MQRVGWLAIVAVLFSSILVDQAFADNRVALVIGNGAYVHVPQLPNPAHDAEDVANALKRVGFQTILAVNLDYAGMQDASIRFARAARTADVAVFYYSGHALQFGGVNYLAPIDAALQDEADLRRMARVDDILSDLQQAKNLKILVLDSCRDNPLADQLKRSIGATRSVSIGRGLAKMESPDGTIISYSTQAGRTAMDGDDRNSPYTTAFLKHIEDKDDISTVFHRISATVYESTRGSQVPELSLSYFGEFYLNGKLELKAALEPSAQCDLLAAAPSDSKRPLGVPGVPAGAIDAARAIPACQSALNADPSNMRIAFQLGRALATDKTPAAQKEAARLYKRAADQGHVGAQNNLGSFYANGRGGLPKDDVEAARLYKLAADQGVAEAQDNLALFYATGRGGLPKDDTEAARLYKLAAAQGAPDAQFYLGGFYASGRGGLQKNDVEAARLYKLAADQGAARAQVSLGYFYETGRGGLQKNDVEAARLYKLATDQGNSTAQNNLATFYANGRGGLPKDDVEAARLYKLAANQGMSLAQNSLAYFYANGRGGLPKDDVEAVRLYKLAADQGVPAAQVGLGFFNQEGRGGLPKNDVEAARLYKLAADQGNAAAQHNLGIFYKTGRGGLQKDEAEAARLYKLAANQGDAKAQADLAYFYATGGGGLQKDDVEAVRLYKLAAGQGYAWAQTNLARYYATGRGGLQKDDVEAMRLYKLAADQGDPDAQKAIQQSQSRKN